MSNQSDRLLGAALSARAKAAQRVRLAVPFIILDKMAIASLLMDLVEPIYR